MQNLSFHDVIRISKHHNFMAKYFMRNHPKRWKDFALDADRFVTLCGLMDKVILLENLPTLYTWLGELLASTLEAPTEKENVGKHKISPDDKELECLMRVNTFDQFFYDLAQRKESES